VTVCTNHYRVIGYPVCIENKRYNRNEYIFNFAMVLDEEADMSGHMSVVRKLARMFRNLEEQSGFLSNEEDEALWDDVTGEADTKRAYADTTRKTSMDLSLGVPHTSGTARGDESGYNTDADSSAYDEPGPGVGAKVYALCEMILEDLNNYGECMIPIDEANTINLKLFPTRAPPAPIYAWHVPLSTVQLTSLNISSDLTLTRVLPYIDGISSVAQISQNADTELKLTRKAIAHLLYYGCIILLDIFQYGAIYAPTAEVGAFVEDEDAQEEAVRYVSVGQYRQVLDTEDGTNNSSAGDQDFSSGERWEWRSSETGITRARIVKLYTSLSQGRTLKDWCLEHEPLISGIDVRRFVTFGVIKGFLYRVHKYAISAEAMGEGTLRKTDDELPQGYAHSAKRHRHNESASTVGRPKATFARFLDGQHCFDEICTELQINLQEAEKGVKKAFEDVQFIHR